MNRLAARLVALCGLVPLLVFATGCDVPTWTPDNAIFYQCLSHTDCVNGWVCVEAEDEQSETPGSNSVSVCLELCPADLWCGARWSCITAEVESSAETHDEANEQQIGVCVPDGLAPASAGGG